MVENKRIQTVADEFVNNKNAWIVNKNIDRDIKGRVRSARKFVFDKEGSRRLGEIIRDIPDLILREQKFARAPYHRIWIEFDFRTMWEVINNKVASPESDNTLAYFIDHDAVYVICDGGKLLPFQYNLHTPWFLEDQLKVCRLGSLSRMQLDQFLWGSTYNTLSEEDRRSLRANHSFKFLELQDADDKTKQAMFAKLIEECYADLRNVIAMLLLINRPAVVNYIKDIPHSRGLVRGKLVPYMSHTVATIHVDPKPLLRLIGSTVGDTIEKRRHEVRGSWCHDLTYRIGNRNDCVHDWISHPKYQDNEAKYHFNELKEAERDNWMCKHCGGHRWWRDDHIRGNSTIGFVEKDYETTI